MKRILKHIIPAMLILAIALTGISFDNATTAHAAMTYKDLNPNVNNVADYQDTPFTMNIGDDKSFELIEVYPEFWFYQTKKYDWTTSDESIVSMEIKRMSAASDEVASFRLTAQKEGTAVITGINKDDATDTVSMTVIVKGATASQTSCKHSWKTTQKVTCLRAGTKTCKLCHMKKSIKRKEHQWKTYKTTKTKYEEYIIFECNYHTDTMDDYCGMLFSELDYGSYDAAYDAYMTHINECRHGMVNWIFRTGYKPVGKYKATVTKCKKCSYTPEEAKQYE